MFVRRIVIQSGDYDCARLGKQLPRICALLWIAGHPIHLSVEAAGQPFNLGSPTQLGQILFDKMKLPALKKTATGKPSTDEVATAFEGISYDAPSGPVKLALGNGHQGIQETAYGTYKFNKQKNTPEVVDVITETPRVRSLVLAVPDWAGHLAGQHVDVRLTAEDGYQAQRSYSISSAPEDDGRLTLTIERLDDGDDGLSRHARVLLDAQARGEIGLDEHPLHAELLSIRQQPVQGSPHPLGLQRALRIETLQRRHVPAQRQPRIRAW